MLTCGDNEERAEVYGCAADRNQASIVFNVAADMVRMCPALNSRVKILESQKRLIYLPTKSIYQVLSADVGNKHVFGVIKQDRNYRRIARKGKKAVTVEILLISTGFNLYKYHNKLKKSQKQAA